jgi:hypothetical protein
MHPGKERLATRGGLKRDPSKHGCIARHHVIVTLKVASISSPSIFSVSQEPWSRYLRRLVLYVCFLLSPSFLRASGIAIELMYTL